MVTFPPLKGVGFDTGPAPHRVWALPAPSGSVTRAPGHLAMALRSASRRVHRPIAVGSLWIGSVFGPVLILSGTARYARDVHFFQHAKARLPPTPQGHWYLHNLSSSEDRNLGSEPSQVVEVVMFKQSKHRKQDPEAGQKSWGGV